MLIWCSATAAASFWSRLRGSSGLSGSSSLTGVKDGGSSGFSGISTTSWSSSTLGLLAAGGRSGGFGFSGDSLAGPLGHTIPAWWATMRPIGLTSKCPSLLGSIVG